MEKILDGTDWWRLTVARISIMCKLATTVATVMVVVLACPMEVVSITMNVMLLANVAPSLAVPCISSGQGLALTIPTVLHCLAWAPKGRLEITAVLIFAPARMHEPQLAMDPVMVSGPAKM